MLCIKNSQNHPVFFLKIIYGFMVIHKNRDGKTVYRQCLKYKGKKTLKRANLLIKRLEIKTVLWYNKITVYGSKMKNEKD